MAALVSLLCLLALLQPAIQQNNERCFGCFCNIIADNVQIDCNSVSIVSVCEDLRSSNHTNWRANNTFQLTFINAPESQLPANVFNGFSQLEFLEIILSHRLDTIRPGAFNGLPALERLLISSNALVWLSAESFQGISSLFHLSLDRNVNLRNLRSDLEPFFSTITGTIELTNIEGFQCDCHLEWLPRFITNISNNPTVLLDDTVCSDPADTPITDPSINFTAGGCSDFCELGYHRCSPFASCQSSSLNGEETTCTCNPGYNGDGFDCSEVVIDMCSSCHDNASCVSGLCVCDTGFTGSGVTCTPLDTCEELCSNDTQCIVSINNGRIDCGSPAVAQLQNTLLLLSVDSSSDPGLTDFTAELVEFARNESAVVPGDLPALVDLLSMTVTVVTNNGELNNRTVDNLIELGSELLEIEKQPLWSEINRTSVTDHVTELFVSIERLGEALFVDMPSDQDFTSANIALVVSTPNCEMEENITISSSLLTSPVVGGDSSLLLPPTVFGESYNCTEVGIIAVVYNGVSQLLNIDGELIPNCTAPLAHGQCAWVTEEEACPMLLVNSVLISAVAVVSVNQSALDYLDTSVLPDPVILTLQHENISLSDPRCSFFQDHGDQWESDETCRTLEFTNTTTVCECYHLTTFAILMSPTGQTSGGRALQIASKVGLCISIICLILTIILLFTLKLETKLHHVHRQLAIALCLSQLIFLIGVDRTEVPSPDVVCTLIAVFLHYFLLCTFAWQLVEGVHLYLFIVKVFFNKKIMWLYYPLAWGIPLIVVAITVGVRTCDYGSANLCWITEGSGTNWAFHAPVIVVIIINLIVMVVVTTIIIKSSRKKEEDKFLVCTLIHASFVLVPVLGITWAFGFLLAVGDETFTVIVEWLFCIFSTLQGVLIFVMHCLLNREVRRAFLKAIGCHEAAQKQQRLTIRRSSAVQSVNQFGQVFKRSFSFSRRGSGPDNLSISMENSSFGGRPQSARSRTAVTNPLGLKSIVEEDSISDSINPTPTLFEKAPHDTSHDTEDINTDPAEHMDRAGNGKDLA